MIFFFFFFKQKTAYEMRISDWSSDVCSSDLQPDDPLDLLGLDPDLGVDAAFAEAVEPERAVGIDHDLGDLRVTHRRGDVGAKRGDQHAALSLGRSRGGTLGGEIGRAHV